MNNIKEIYKLGFIKYLNDIIDFKKYDNWIENSNLLFGISKSHENNVSSNYYSLLNDFYIEKLSEEDKKILSDKKTIDEEVVTIVKKTYKEVLKKSDYNTIMYNPPLPEHSVKNGSIVFEFVYGKNIKKINDDNYAQLIKKQREFIKMINAKLIKEIYEKIDSDSNIFVEKRV